MSTRALTYTLIHRRGSRAFFLAHSTQQVERMRGRQARGGVVREIARAALAVAAVIGWGAVALLLGP